MILDNLIVTDDTDDNDTDTDGFTALRNKPTPKLRFPSGPKLKDRDNLASSIRNKPGSPGKC